MRTLALVGKEARRQSDREIATERWQGRKMKGPIVSSRVPVFAIMQMKMQESSLEKCQYMYKNRKFSLSPAFSQLVVVFLNLLFKALLSNGKLWF